jgi:hypothetical protein
MDLVYVFLDINNWEDIIIFLSKEDAINESKKYPNARVEIFKININDEVGYTPTYNFYKNGELIENYKYEKYS